MTKRFNIEPTSHCQLKCPLCPTPVFEGKRQGFMQYEHFEQLIQDAFGYRIMEPGDEAHLYGFGEPLLHKQLSDMISCMSQNGVQTKINTNGLLLTPGKSDELSDAGLTKALVSLDGISAEDYAQYRIGGDFDKLLKNLQEVGCRKRTYFLEVQFIAFAYNVGKEAQAEQLAREIGADVFVLKKPKQWFDNRRDNSLFLNVPAGYKRRFDATECVFGQEMGFVHYNGDLTICTNDPFGKHTVGNVFRDGARLWQSPIFLEERARGGRMQLSSCTNCGYNDAYLQKIKLR